MVKPLAVHRIDIPEPWYKEFGSATTSEKTFYIAVNDKSDIENEIKSQHWYKNQELAIAVGTTYVVGVVVNLISYHVMIRSNA